MAKRKEKSLLDRFDLALPSIMDSFSIGSLIFAVSWTLALVPMFTITKPYFAAITILIAPILFYKYFKGYHNKNSFLFGINLACPIMFAYLLMHENFFRYLPQDITQNIMGPVLIYSMIHSPDYSYRTGYDK